MIHKVRPKGVCSYGINFELCGNVVKNISFDGGCDGNLKALSKAVDGKTVEEIEALFAGITCDIKKTSCADQLAKAVRKAFDKERE